MKRFTMHQMAVLVFILMLLRVISRVKSLDFCFDASLEGKAFRSFFLSVCCPRLVSSVFTTVLELCTCRMDLSLTEITLAV